MQYEAGTSDWRAFLLCWKGKVARLPSYASPEDSQSLKANQIAPRGNPTPETLQALDSLERHVGKRLPPSYRAFQLATRGTGWYAAGDGFDFVESGRRRTLYPLSHVDLLVRSDARAMRDWLSQWRDFRKESAASYYRYGHRRPSQKSNQNELEFEGAQLQGMVKVGGHDGGHLVLLNPAETAADGEMEAWVLAPWHGAVRYPSFAALLREMAYRDIGNRGGYLVEPSRLDATPCLASVSTKVVQ